MLMVSAKHCSSKQSLVRLWIHESMRVFHDRLIDSEDKAHFKAQPEDPVAKKNGNANDMFPQNGSILFGDFLQPDLEMEDRVYQEVNRSSCSNIMQLHTQC